MSGMGQSNTGTSGGGPKILLAKPTTPRPEGSAGGAAGLSGVVKLMRDREEDVLARVRLPHGSLNLLSESWEINPDRLFPFLSDNMDSMVIGVLGPPGVGKSTIMNELYGFTGTSPGVLPPFPVQSDEIRAGARHCSVGIEPRISAERLILLDCQPVFSASVLMDLMRSDGFANISVHNGDALSAELAHELIALQLGVFLSSVCHVLLVVSEGLHDLSMWRLIQKVEMLKQGVPDPSTVLAAPSGQAFSVSVEKDKSDLVTAELSEFCSEVIFVHTKYVTLSYKLGRDPALKPLVRMGSRETQTFTHLAQSACILSFTFIHKVGDPVRAYNRTQNSCQVQWIVPHYVCLLNKHECSWPEIQCLGKALSRYFPSPTFKRNMVVNFRPPPFLAAERRSKNEDFLEKERGAPRGQNGVISLSGRTPVAPRSKDGAGLTSKEGEEKGDKKTHMDQGIGVNFFVLPLKAPDELTQHHHESYTTLLATLRDQILSMPRRPFARPVTERDWLRNAVRVWDLVKKSRVLAEYTSFIHSSGLYRR